MPETIDINKTAFVSIDLQNGIIKRDSSPYSGVQVVHNASRLARAFSEKGAFVVLVRVATIDGKDMLRPNTDVVGHHMQLEDGWDNLVPELKSIKNAHIITKRQWGAFYGTDLDLQLRRRGIDTIVLCGVSTGFGVDMTAREAYQLGYNQIFAEDAMTASVKEQHDYVIKNIFPRIGKVRTCGEIIEMLS